ncbi:IclR family transcriptional regulator [Ramlibacter sp.]|uniref:IclR family transcriptional regulator n=1 Tax=Ramlibacter sp. TaxID=1917967 RepID=UPI003D113089
MSASAQPLHGARKRAAPSSTAEPLRTKKAASVAARKTKPPREDNAAKGVIARTTALMRALVEAGEPQSVKALGEQLHLAPSTVHRLLEELLRAEWVVRTPQHRYRAALEFFRLGALTTHHIAPVALAQSALHEIVQRCDETAIFAMQVGNEPRMVFVEQRNPSHPLRYRFRMHKLRPLVWGSAGRAILAWLPEAQQRLALAEAAPSESGWAAPDWDTWAEEAKTIRKRGYAMSRGHFIDWAVGFAAPVFGSGDALVGCVLLIVPEQRFRSDRANFYIHTLLEQARLLSASLGAARRRTAGDGETLQ